MAVWWQPVATPLARWSLQPPSGAVGAAPGAGVPLKGRWLRSQPAGKPPWRRWSAAGHAVTMYGEAWRFRVAALVTSLRRSISDKRTLFGDGNGNDNGRGLGLEESAPRANQRQRSPGSR